MNNWPPYTGNERAMLMWLAEDSVPTMGLLRYASEVEKAGRPTI